MYKWEVLRFSPGEIISLSSESLPILFFNGRGWNKWSHFLFFSFLFSLPLMTCFSVPQGCFFYHLLTKQKQGSSKMSRVDLVKNQWQNKNKQVFFYGFVLIFIKMSKMLTKSCDPPKLGNNAVGGSKSSTILS